MRLILSAMQHKILSVFSVLCMLLVLSPRSAYAASESYDLWTGTTEAPDLSGTTYTVSTAAQLAWVAQHNDDENGFSGKLIELTVNVDLSGAKLWTAIGSAAKPFAGTFDGKGHLIRGLGIIRGADGVGLFGHIGATGVVKNIGISGGRILAGSKRRVGALAGVCAGSIENSWSMAQIAIAGNMVGGLVGDLLATGKLTDVYSAGLILQGADTLGSLVGRNAGHITRAYSIGYAKNGKGFVGVDKDGAYADCFYDRKLYYQEPGVWGDKVTPIDSTALLFSALSGEKWATTDLYYPQLKSFVGTDASLLSVAPMYINTEVVEPVNHANDLTEDFTVTTLGGIAWACEDVNDEEWIKISGSNIKVVRPCTETDVLVDAKLRNETHVVYMRPRRLEDLRIDPFDEGPIPAYCLNEGEKLPAMPKVYDGTPSYHFRVVLDSLDTQSGNIVPFLVLADDDLAAEKDFEDWKNENVLKTDVAGHFYLRLFVHDDGCVIDWKECPSMYEYIVYDEVVLGTITSGTDTVVAPYKLTLTGTPTTGGKGTITYQWTCNDEEISGATGLNLTDYNITKADTYVFLRYSADEKCHMGDGREPDHGTYTLVVVDPLDPGEVDDEGKRVFCTVSAAKEQVISATQAKGSVVSLGYSYQWYRVLGTDTVKIAGATEKDLNLSLVDMTAGNTYIFFREVKSNWWRMPDWKESAGHQEIQILPALTVGAIQSADLGLQCLEADASTFAIAINEATAAAGDATLHYQWVYEVNGNTTTIDEDSPTLNYTLTLDQANAGQVYTFRRYVRQGSCDWEKSDGEVTVTFGWKQHFERTITVCEGELPYTFVCFESDGARHSHKFTADGETWLFTDQSTGGCDVDTLFTLHMSSAPHVEMETEARFCQESRNITLYYTLVSGDADRFRITYSPSLATYIGRNDTTGEITTPGAIVLTNIPSIGEGDNYMVVELAYSGGGTNIGDLCYSQSNTVRFFTSLGGYVHSKYDRVLFVDNNPKNGEVPDPKLSFVSYQWYRNGVLQPDQTDQYYHENGQQLSGVYYVKLTDSEGRVYYSCEVMMPTGASSIAPQQRIYPVPVNAGEMVTVECEDADIYVISTRGERVLQRTDVQDKTTFTAPPVVGVYFVRYEFKDGRVATDKLIVK